MTCIRIAKAFARCALRVGALAFMMTLVCAPPVHAQVTQVQGTEEAQSTPAGESQKSRRLLTEAIPSIVERRAVFEGVTYDPRFRFDIQLGDPKQDCATWRVESFVRPGGRMVFQLNDPGDAKVLQDWKYAEKSIEFVLGDANCSYRIRIERHK
jgi:hypothetical protein